MRLWFWPRRLAHPFLAHRISAVEFLLDDTSIYPYPELFFEKTINHRVEAGRNQSRFLLIAMPRVYVAFVLSFCVLLYLAKPEGITASERVHQRYRRQVPQEWSHAPIVKSVDKSLQMDNPLKIKHAVFALLGDKGAAFGRGQFDVKNIDCFQKMVADQAFTNAKKANDLPGMENAIIFASLERNTAGITVRSAECKSLKATNPDIDRLIQHQDAAAQGAKDNNQKSALLAALSLKKIGGDIKRARETGTFAPGDNTKANNGAGLSCNVEKDEAGCIFSQKLLVPDVTDEEVNVFLAKHGN